MEPLTTMKGKFTGEYARATADGRQVNYLIVAVQLPTGAKEIIINNSSDIPGKVQYYLDTYDYDLRMKRVPEIRILDFMFV